MQERWKIVLWASSAITLLLTLLGFVLLPWIVADRLNPTAERPPYDPTPEAIELHETLTVADLHSDALLWDRTVLRRSSIGHTDLPRLVEGRVALQTFGAVTKTPWGTNIERNAADSDQITALAVIQGWPPPTWTSLAERAIYQASKLHRAAEDSRGSLELVKSAADLDRLLETPDSNPPAVAALLAIEGAHALQGDVANVDRLFEAGFRLFGLAHFFDNSVGGSAHGLDKGGLTAFGRSVLTRMVELGVTVDVAHASPRLIDDVVSSLRRPVVVSHTGVRGTCDITRNLGDTQIAKIAESGGVIGVGLWTQALCGDTPRDWARAVRHAVSVAGVEHVGLGSDWDGAVEAVIDASQTVYLTDALLREGFDADAIRLIMGENVIRILRQNLPPE